MSELLTPTKAKIKITIVFFLFSVALVLCDFLVSYIGNEMLRDKLQIQYQIDL